MDGVLHRDKQPARPRFRVRAVMLPLVAMLGLAGPTDGQVLGTGVMPVTEVGPSLLQNTITAGQSVLSVKNELLNLLPLDVIFVAEDLLADMQQLGVIVAQIDGLASDVQSLQQQLADLFGLDTAPASTRALQSRLVAIRSQRWLAYQYAMKLQTLISTALCTVDHVSALIQSLKALAGEKQLLQTISQQQAVLIKTMTIQTTQTAAFQRAGSADKMEELLTVESLQRINAAVMADWPK